MLRKLYSLTIAFILSFTAAHASAWYVQDADPWGQTTNTTAMNSIFGVGNWTLGSFSTPAATIFAPGTTFVMLEGSDGNSNLPTYITANQTIIENWVNAGGKLFINAAPNYGTNQSWGFDSTILNYPSYAGAVATSVPGNQIFMGPYLPTTTNYTGNSFAHGYITGTGLTSLLYDQAFAPDINSVLCYKAWGNGIVYFGACTQPNYWTPATEGLNLWQNIIASVANAAPLPCATPDSLTVSNITVDGATFHWTGTATTYEYVIDTNAAAPIASGDTVMADTLVVTGLQHDATYYFHVRALCDSTNASAWVTISFSTLHLVDCAAPTGYATVSFTQVSPYATLHWSSANAVQYFWVLDNTSTDPAVNGNATTNTSISFANLVANVTYYFHVRCICTNGDTSVWTTIPFVTASCPFPTATASVNETPVGPYAAINWSAPTAATYYWVLDHSASDPAGMGNMTTNTTLTFANLWTGTDYYFHLRCICTNGDTSIWTTIMFHTPGPTNVNNTSNDGTTVICSPNPTTGKVTISITGAVYADAKLTLSGMDGKVISDIPVTANKAVVDMSNLPAALYFIKYTNKDYSDVIKVMKQ